MTAHHPESVSHRTRGERRRQDARGERPRAAGQVFRNEFISVGERRGGARAACDRGGSAPSSVASQEACGTEFAEIRRLTVARVGATCESACGVCRVSSLPVYVPDIPAGMYRKFL